MLSTGAVEITLSEYNIAVVSPGQDLKKPLRFEAVSRLSPSCTWGWDNGSGCGATFTLVTPFLHALDHKCKQLPTACWLDLRQQDVRLRVCSILDNSALEGCVQCSSGSLETSQRCRLDGDSEVQGPLIWCHFGMVTMFTIYRLLFSILGILGLILSRVGLLKGRRPAVQHWLHWMGDISDSHRNSRGTTGHGSLARTWLAKRIWVLENFSCPECKYSSC